MRWPLHEPYIEAHMARVEEKLEEADAWVALQALLRDSRAPRRRTRVWLGSVLLAVGHRLLRSVPEPHVSTAPHEIRGTEP